MCYVMVSASLQYTLCHTTTCFRCTTELYTSLIYGVSAGMVI